MPFPLSVGVTVNTTNPGVLSTYGAAGRWDGSYRFEYGAVPLFCYSSFVPCFSNYRIIDSLLDSGIIQYSLSNKSVVFDMLACSCMAQEMDLQRQLIV